MWDHTSVQLSMTYNANRSPKTKPARMEDFHPFRKRKRVGMKASQVKSMRPIIEAIARSMR